MADRTANSLIITIIAPDQPPMTQLCRIRRSGNDLDAVELYSNLGRRICTQKPDLDTAMQWLENVECARKQYREPIKLAGLAFCNRPRNDYLVQESDVVVSHITHTWGGVYKYVAKAKKKRKRIINIEDFQF